MLAASLALRACSTPYLKPSVAVPGQSAAAPADHNEPEVAWWEKFGDPVLSDLVRRAERENRGIQSAQLEAALLTSIAQHEELS